MVENQGKAFYGKVSAVAQKWRRWFFAENKTIFANGGSLLSHSESSRTSSPWAIWGYSAFALLFVYVMFVTLGIDMRGWALNSYLVIMASVWLLWRILRPSLMGPLLDRLPLSTILVTALALRLIWVLSSGVTQTSDFEAYDATAVSIAHGGKWISPTFPSGASIFFASFYAIFGHHPLVPQIASALLSTLQVLLVYALARRTMGGDRAGKIAALVLTFWPEHIFYTNLLGTEVLFATLVLAAVWLLWSDRRGYVIRLFAAGMILGLANWVRPNAPIALVALMAFVLLRKIGEEGWLPRVRYGLALAAGFAILVAPILWINYRDRGETSVVISKKSGYNLMFGTSIEGRGCWNSKDCELLDAEVARRTCPANVDPEVFKNNVAREIGLKRFHENPWDILKMAIRYKIAGLWGCSASLCWSFETSRFFKYYGAACSTAAYYHFVVFTLATVVVFRHRAWFLILDERWFYVAFVLLATASHILLEIQPRYHHTYLPIFAICLGGYAQSLRQNAVEKIVPFGRGEAVERLFPEMRKAA